MEKSEYRNNLMKKRRKESNYLKIANKYSLMFYEQIIGNKMESGNYCERDEFCICYCNGCNQIRHYYDWKVTRSCIFRDIKYEYERREYRKMLLRENIYISQLPNDINKYILFEYIEVTVPPKKVDKIIV